MKNIQPGLVNFSASLLALFRSLVINMLFYLCISLHLCRHAFVISIFRLLRCAVHLFFHFFLFFYFQAMLLFIYSDKLPDVDEITGSASVCTSTIMVQHLLAAADRFGLDRLKLLCESKLCKEVSAETVATTLALAEQHRCPQLKAICLKFAATPSILGGACCP